SQQKKTTAAKLKLTADDAGRIAGSYLFTDADPLDAYELTIPGFKGSARVSLAEFRKSKIKLQITGKREGERMRLHFHALDFLAQPVPGSRVQFTAQVVRNPARPEGGELKGEDFVYAADKASAGPRLEDLGEEEQLLLRAGGSQPPTLGGSGPTVAAQV